MASRSPDEAGSFLPSKFLSEADAVFATTGKEFKMFPTEFPYEFDSPADESESSDEDDFFASLARRFPHSTPNPKPEVVAGSPQSTLSGMGSWSANGSPNGPSQVTSPPTTPFAGKDDTWDLIYAAAGQVARLKMASHSRPHQLHNHGKCLLAPPSFSNNPPQFGGLKAEMVVPGKPPVSAQHLERQREMTQYLQFCHQQQQLLSRARTYNGGVRCGGRPLNLLRQSAWPPLQNPTQPVLPAGSGVKRECAGTGVFLPRRYSNPIPEPRKKPAGCPNVLLPVKAVQALSLSFEDMASAHTHPRFNCGLLPDQQAFIARRNALLEQQRRSLRPEVALNHEVRLPQEWTY